MLLWSKDWGSICSVSHWQAFQRQGAPRQAAGGWYAPVEVFPDSEDDAFESL